ncbi:hypothetical protein PENSPDRAFT_671549 [Peniophora sp. CONT]|nr:hypothetical protein PENSPDRAFT_671549 [Peniophora sp. CONT]
MRKWGWKGGSISQATCGAIPVLTCTTSSSPPPPVMSTCRSTTKPASAATAQGSGNANTARPNTCAKKRDSVSEELRQAGRDNIADAEAARKAEVAKPPTRERGAKLAALARTGHVPVKRNRDNVSDDEANTPPVAKRSTSGKGPTAATKAPATAAAKASSKGGKKKDDKKQDAKEKPADEDDDMNEAQDADDEDKNKDERRGRRGLQAQQ